MTMGFPTPKLIPLSAIEQKSEVETLIIVDKSLEMESEWRKGTADDSGWRRWVLSMMWMKQMEKV